MGQIRILRTALHHTESAAHLLIAHAALDLGFCEVDPFAPLSRSVGQEGSLHRAFDGAAAALHREELVQSGRGDLSEAGLDDLGPVARREGAESGSVDGGRDELILRACVVEWKEERWQEGGCIEGKEER